VLTGCARRSGIGLARHDLDSGEDIEQVEKILRGLPVPCELEGG
jgi:hypothetical protein